VNVAPGTEQKPATAARIYDYHLGGTHNFPADRAAAIAVTERFPLTPAIARTGRAFLRRSVGYLADNGVRQFLDIGSGIPTAGNVHEIAQRIAPQSRVVYVDIDPVAVSESLEILEGNPNATAIRADARFPRAILDHPQVRRLLDFDAPVAVLLCAVLHFVPEDAQARETVRELVAAVPSGSYLVVSHAGTDDPAADDGVEAVKDVYKRQTATPFAMRTRSAVAGFFDGLELVEPGVVWSPQWRPEPGDPADFVDNPQFAVGLCGVGRKP
jgi:O-methyltransferase involved in polyketide biosynthesis